MDKYWVKNIEYQFSSYNVGELDKIIEIANKLKKTAKSKPEFLDVIREYVKDKPGVTLICTGYIGKGAWESEGECFSENWYSIDQGEIGGLFREKGREGDPDHLLNKFSTKEDFINACVNCIWDRNEIMKLTKNSLHMPKWEDSDAADLSNGDCSYQFIDINTEKIYWITNNAYD